MFKFKLCVNLLSVTVQSYSEIVQFCLLTKILCNAEFEKCLEYMAHRVCSYNLAFIGVAIYTAPSESDAMKPFANCKWLIKAKI